ncbi:hypothetical protein OG994_28880 [Micromonospora globbae]|uniref:Uncharacterized protein n=1 Tax=Micromonospora globbae TaxID=1894969 RepID=A0ABZ1S5A3_9ACTN|nr:hypothetical protein [Micromonospora globbae]
MPPPHQHQEPRKARVRQPGGPVRLLGGPVRLLGGPVRPPDRRSGVIVY